MPVLQVRNLAVLDAKLVATPPLTALPPDAPRRSFRKAAADFWLGVLFKYAPKYGEFFCRAEGPFCAGAFRCSRMIRRTTTLNARRILGPGASEEAIESTARAIVKNFYRFCCDV